MFEKNSIKPYHKNFSDFFVKIPKLSEKTFAITGTTSGTGFVAAKTLAQKGARVILLNRKSKRVQNCLDLIEAENPNSKIITIECDLQDFASVQKASLQIIEKCPSGLDGLCNNAGIMAHTDTATINGYDIQMQTNHLSHFLLTLNLKPALQKAQELRGEARIVNHSSIARFGVKKLEAQYLEKRGGNLGGNGTRMFLFAQGRWIRYCQSN